VGAELARIAALFNVPCRDCRCSESLHQSPSRSSLKGLGGLTNIEAG
jgi:hypothetical protein